MRIAGFAALLALAACGGDEERFAGAWEGPRVTLKLERDGEGYTGTLSVGGAEHAVTARPKDEGLEGSFRSGGSEFPLEATLEGDALVLKSGGARHELRRPKPAPAKNPLEEVGNPLVDVDNG